MSAAPPSGAGPRVSDPRPWPKFLEFQRGARQLRIGFEDGVEFLIPFELLRVESPSAAVQGHGASDKRLVRGKAMVGVVECIPIGRYAVKLRFDDGHDTGIFAWDWLFRLGRDQIALLAAYRQAVENGKWQ